MFKSFYFFLVYLTYALSINGQQNLSNFKNCNQYNYYSINLTQLIFKPNPIEIGKGLIAEVSGTNSVLIQSGAKMSSYFYYNNELVDYKSYDLCIDIIGASGGNCPIEPGNFNISAKSIPSVSLDYPVNSSYTYNVTFTGNKI